MTIVLSFLAYTAALAPFALPWLRIASHAVPVEPLVNTTDQFLVAWILAWVAQALASDPLHVLDAPINHPAPAQLTGMEHFASTQIAFAPVYWGTGNAILSANAVALLSYPLTALVMERLLLALGSTRLVAWTGGLVFTLAGERAPGGLMVLKYANLYLPLVALTLTRLREHPNARAAAIAALAMTLAFFSSYYLAVMVAITAAVWGIFELARPEAGRARFALLSAAAAIAALALLTLASLPYLTRAHAFEMRELAFVVNSYFSRTLLGNNGRLVLTLAAVGGMAIGARAPGARRAAARGLVLTMLAQILMLGSSLPTQDGALTLPFALVAASPASFFRYAFRLVVVAGFGVTLLVAAALEAGARRLGRVPGGIAVAAVAAAVLVTRGPDLVRTRIAECVPQQEPIYDEVRDVARARGAGPLLELPVIGMIQDTRRRVGTEIESMIGATRHRLPLVVGYSDYQPPHRPLVHAALAALPEREALEDLVDMTHVRWILLRPLDEWPEVRLPVRSGLLSHPLLSPAGGHDGWQLLRVEREPRHPEWYAAIAAGPRPGRSVLGTPLEAIPEDAARAQTVARSVPSLLGAGRLMWLDVRAWNRGSRGWPTVVPPNVPQSYTMRLVVAWKRDGSDAVETTDEFELVRDVPPGDRVAQRLLVKTPPERGMYQLEIRVRQVDGAAFTAPANVWHRQRVELAG